MRGRRTFGWIVVLVGALGLLISILHDYHFNIGPFMIIYKFFDWFSISALIELLLESFGAVLKFISNYFWALVLICLGMAIIFGAKRQEQYDYDLNFDYDSDERHKRLHHVLCRNLDDMKLAGVCAGIARKFELDPTIIRILALFLLFMSWGTVLFIYLLLAFLLPGEHLG